jgi:hypothetical protein
VPRHTHQIKKTPMCTHRNLYKKRMYAIQNPRAMPPPPPHRPLIVFDMDNTLLHSVPLDTPGGKELAVQMARANGWVVGADGHTACVYNGRLAILRPYVRTCFAILTIRLGYRVAIWSAGNARHVSVHVENVLRHLLPVGVVFAAVLHATHCQNSVRLFGNYKDLRYLAVLGVVNVERIQHPEGGLLLVDDHRGYRDTQPSNFVHVPAYMCNLRDVGPPLDPYSDTALLWLPCRIVSQLELHSVPSSRACCQEEYKETDPGTTTTSGGEDEIPVVVVGETVSIPAECDPVHV